MLAKLLSLDERAKQLTEQAENPYGAALLGSKYQGQAGPTASRYWKNFE